MSDALELRGITVRYGATSAVSAATLAVPGGALVGLIGPNGAGKTTLLDAVTGFTPMAEGQVILAGEDVTGLAPHRLAAKGLGRTWQSIELFEELPIRDNLELGTRRPRWWSPIADLVRPGQRAADPALASAVGLLEIADVLDELPTEVPNGTRRLVGIARALACRPTVLLLDEPAAGLDPSETEQLRHTLRAIVASGVSLLLIDHDVNLMMTACDHLYVLDFGVVIASGSPDAVRRDPRVVRAFLGEPAAA